ncbi:MAG: oligosaccharide flippase family protein [Planctomycetia bacterium]|nr:oligosaccharide flippase family protein [Planctomycetia bacterium]
MATIEAKDQARATAGTYYPRRRPLHHVAAWTLFGTLTYSGAQAAILTVLAKLGSAEVVGDYALALAVASPVTALGRLGMRPLVATETGRELSFQDYLTVQLLTVPLCLAVLFLVAMVGPFRPEVACTILTLGCAKLAESTGTVFFGLMDRHERQRRIAQSMFFKGVLGVAAVALAFWLTHSTAISGGALASAWLLTIAVGDAPLASRLCRTDGTGAHLWHWPGLTRIRRVAGLCLTVGFTAAIREFNLDLPSYFVRSVLGRTSMGYYAGVSAVNRLSRIVFRSFNQAASPRLAQYFHTEPAAFVRLSAHMLLMCATLGAAAVLMAITFGGPILSALYRPEYAAYKTTLVLMSVEVAFGLGSVSLRQSMIAARYLRSQIPQVLVTTLILSAACALLVPRFGLNGVACACVIASVIDLLTGLSSLVFLFRRERIRTRDAQEELTPISATP